MSTVREEFEKWWQDEHGEAPVRDGESYKGRAFDHWATWKQSRNAAVESSARKVECSWGLWSNLPPDDSRRLGNFLATQVRSMGVECMECGAFRDTTGKLWCKHGDQS